MKENAHLAFKDDILSLENKKEATKEDFLDIIAQNAIKIIQSMPASPPLSKFMIDLLETAQGFLKEPTKIVES